MSRPRWRYFSMAVRIASKDVDAQGRTKRSNPTYSRDSTFSNRTILLPIDVKSKSSRCSRCNCFMYGAQISSKPSGKHVTERQWKLRLPISKRSNPLHPSRNRFSKRGQPDRITLIVSCRISTNFSHRVRHRHSTGVFTGAMMQFSTDNAVRDELEYITWGNSYLSRRKLS